MHFPPPKRCEFTGLQGSLVPEMQMLGWDHFHVAEPRLHEHRHPGAWEICYIVRGSVEWWAEDTRREVRGGDLYLTRPDERHGGINAMMHPCELFWIIVSLPADSPLTGLDDAESQEIRRQFESLHLRSFPGSPAVEEHFQHLLSVHLEPPPLAAIEARSTFHRLLLRVFECHRRHAESLSTQPNRSPQIQRAIDWMLEHLAEDFAIEDAAEAAGLSTSHFHAAFLQQTGFTPSDFRQRHRIQRAKQLLQNTSLSISTIAFDLGFSTSQYFATVFRKITGISPREYRTSVAESH